MISDVALGWALYAVGILPAAMLFLWLARKLEVPRRHEAPAAVALAIFWPAMLLLVIGSVGWAAIRIALDPWWGWWLLGKLTWPLYRLHCWCAIKMMMAAAREAAAKKGQES